MDNRQEALNIIAQQCRTDLFFLCKYILNYERMEPHVHQELCDYTTSILPNFPPEKIEGLKKAHEDFDPRKNLLLLLMPRGTFKSTVVTVGFTLQMFLNEPNARVLIDSETFSKSKAFLREILEHIVNNERYREVFKTIHGVFPFTKKSEMKLWTDSEVILPCRNVPKKEPSISCAGIDVTKNGMHYDLIICDDLHSEKNVTNKEQIQQVIDHYKLAFSLLDPGKPLIIIGCLTGDSKVLMEDGTYLPIKEVVVGSKVWSWDETTQKLTKKTVEAMIPQGIAKVYEIKTKRHALRATGNHPFLTINGWKKAEELTKEDWLLTIKKINTDYRKKMPSGKFMNQSFAWLFGVMMGDGWVGKSETRGYMAVAKGVDEKLNLKICDEIEKQFGRRPYETKFGCYRLDSIKAQRLFTGLGLVGGAKGKRLPSWLFKSRPDIKRAFLRGLIDADGYKQIRGNAHRIELSNYELVEDIRLLSLTSGVRPTSIHSRTRRLQPPNSKKPVLNTSYSIGLTFQNSTENHTVYKQAYLLREQGIRIDRVESVIELAEKQEVFDLTVADTHNFIADGMVVHNTRWDYNDLYQHIMDFEAEDFNILIKSAYNPDGSLLFPEVLSEEALDKIRRRQGTGIFSKQYLNNPVSDENATFKRDQMIRKPWSEVEGRPMNWYLSVDPSYYDPRGITQYGDFSTLVLAGMDFQKNIYVRHIIRKKMTYSELINEIFNVYTSDKFDDIKNMKIIIEVIGTKSLSYELSNEQKRRNTWLPIQEIRSRPLSTKEERIRGLAPFYEYEHIFHIKECPQLEELEYELLHFPSARHDDIIDALATVLEVASPPSVRNQEGSGYQRGVSSKRLMSYKPRSSITGV